MTRIQKFSNIRIRIGFLGGSNESCAFYSNALDGDRFFELGPRRDFWNGFYWKYFGWSKFCGRSHRFCAHWTRWPLWHWTSLQMLLLLQMWT